MAIAELYLSYLISEEFHIVLPCTPDWADSAWHLFVIRTKQRDKLQKSLTEAGICTMTHYPIPPHLQRAYSPIGLNRSDFPLAETMADESLSLPIGPQLGEEATQYIMRHMNSM